MARRSADRIEDDPRYQEIMDEREAIEAPCDPSLYRILKRIVSNPDNYFTVGFGAGSIPAISANCALAVLIDELELRPHLREVWGVSAGAVVGGGYCSGSSGHQILDLLMGMDPKKSVAVPKWEIFKTLLGKHLPEGIMHGQHFSETIDAGLVVKTFEECDPPLFLIMCTDDGRARKVIKRSGPLLIAVRASMCIPGVIFPIMDWQGESHGYLDGALVEKTPLPSIIEEHARQDRPEQLVVLCTHYDDTGRVTKPRGFIQRSLRSMDRMADVVWAHQLMTADQAPNCKHLVLNPRLVFTGMFDLDCVLVNYLWARKKFKEQLSNAQIGTRFTAR